MQISRRNRRAVVGGLLLMSATVALLVASVPQQRHLLARSKRITDAPDQSSPARFGPSRGAHFVWLSDVEAVGLSFEGYEDHAFLLNASTGVRTPIEALNDTFKTITPSGEQHLSPDGKWLLWTGVRNTQHLPAAYGKRYVLPAPGRQFYQGFRVVATALDGSRHVERQQGSDLAWLPNSQGWVRYLWGQSGVSIRSSVQGQPLASSEKTEKTVPTLPLTQGMVRVLGMRPNNHLLVCCMPPPAVRGHYAVQLYDIALGSDPPSVNTCTLTLPAAWSAMDLALSPSGDRLAWKTIGNRRPFPDFVLRLLPFIDPSPRPVIGLWVSRVDGSDLHEIGDEDAPVIDGWDQHLYDLGWTPNGKRVSFIFHGSLWTAPAD